MGCLHPDPFFTLAGLGLIFHIPVSARGIDLYLDRGVDCAGHTVLVALEPSVVFVTLVNRAGNSTLHPTPIEALHDCALHLFAETYEPTSIF